MPVQLGGVELLEVLAIAEIGEFLDRIDRHGDRRDEGRQLLSDFNRALD